MGAIALNGSHEDTKEAVAALLKVKAHYPGGQALAQQTNSLIKATIWADLIKQPATSGNPDPLLTYYATCHYINANFNLGNKPLNQKIAKAKLTRAIAKAINKDRCNVITVIRQSIKTLASQQASQQQQAIALRLLLHMVGDIHQPLHTANPWFKGKPTYGGNAIKLIDTSVNGLKRKPKKILIDNLHQYWDAAAGLYPDMIKPVRGGFNESAYKQAAQIVVKQLTAKERQQARLAGALNWGAESLVLAQRYTGFKKLTYRQCGGQIIAYFKQPAQYRQKVQQVSRQQLLLAGLRLAHLLNALFSSQAEPGYQAWVKAINDNPTINLIRVS
jgi:hypothetical protein